MKVCEDPRAETNANVFTSLKVEGRDEGWGEGKEVSYFITRHRHLLLVCSVEGL